MPVYEIEQYELHTRNIVWRLTARPRPLPSSSTESGPVDNSLDFIEVGRRLWLAGGPEPRPG